MAVRWRNLTQLGIVCFVGLALLLALPLFFSLHQVYAVPIGQARDYISSDTLFAPNTSHFVSFKVPDDGHSITPSDYIRITLPNYTSVTAPNSGGGWSGAPSYGVTGNTAFITGVSAAPGTWISIGGITATNPGASSFFGVQLDVSSDLAGTTIYDSTNFNASPLKGVTTVSVTIGTPTSSLTVTGFASPGAFIKILIDGVVMGTTTADALGNFSKTITGITPTSHQIEIQAEDILGNPSTPIVFNQLFIAGIIQEVSNVVVSPSININSVWVVKDGTFTLSGYGTPGAQLTITVSDVSDYQILVTPDVNGYWSYTFDTVTNPLLLGAHQAYARQIVPGGYQSNFSPVINFTVLECSGNIADINCDGRVNLTDFSIMMFYWKDINPANKRTDLNSDNVVNLTDFSILLFNWTG